MKQTRSRSVPSSILSRYCDSLSTQLEAAVQQTQDLAVKSIEGSAHEKSFKALKEIVLE